MKTTQGNMLLSLRNVQGFLQSNAAKLGTVIEAGTTKELDDAIVTLGGHASDQNQTLIEAKSTTQTQEALRSKLIQFRMAPINRIARLKLANTPELSAFRMPRGRLTVEKLKSFADGMSKAAARFSNTFIAAGLPADFIAQLDATSTAMAQAQTARAQRSADRAGATKSLKTMLSTGRRIVHVLDTFVREAIDGDSGLLQIWNTVKRVPRTGSSTTPAAPVPATPAASTPAVAEQSHNPAA